MGLVLLRPEDGIMEPASGSPSAFEAVSDLDGFDSLNAHDRLRQTPIELSIPLDMTSETYGHVKGFNRADSANGITGGTNCFRIPSAQNATSKQIPADA